MCNNMKIANSLEEFKALADERAAEIMASEDCLEYTGTAYYISNNGDNSNSGKSPEEAWATPDAYMEHKEEIKAGDAVLFERGSVFRLSFMITLVNGVKYGAYGKGEKPLLIGSMHNYAEKGFWTKHSENIWKCPIENDWDAGMIIFDEGEYVGWKKRNINDIKENFDFCHDRETSALYLYLEGDSPEARFKDIEIGRRYHIFQSYSAQDIQIDNISMRYGGAMGIAIHNSKNVKITNCEVGWFGGCYHSVNYDKDDNLCRFGNGIENFGSAHGFTIENCWVYQCFDAGITTQGSGQAVIDNVLFKGNLLESSTFNVEFWAGSDGYIKNFKICDNIMTYGGLGFGEFMRTDYNWGSQINAWMNYWEDCENLEISGNTFLGEYRWSFCWRWTNKGDHPGLDVYGNSFYNNGKFRSSLGHNAIWCLTQEQLEKNITQIDRAPGVLKLFDYQEWRNKNWRNYSTY